MDGDFSFYISISYFVAKVQLLSRLSVNMADKVYVVETLTSGPDGYPYDEIIDIGICAVDLENKDFETVYNSMVYYDPKNLGKKKLDYISENFNVYAEELYGGEPEKKVAEEVLSIIKGKTVACYDIRQEFGKYMICAPWDITYETSIMPGISLRMPISLRCKLPEDEPFIIRKAYKRLLPGDPANVGRNRRAVDLAAMASALMIELRAKGKY